MIFHPNPMKPFEIRKEPERDIISQSIAHHSGRNVLDTDDYPICTQMYQIY